MEQKETNEQCDLMGEAMCDLDKILGAKTRPHYQQIRVIVGSDLMGLYCTH